MSLPVYNLCQTYRDNFANPPAPVQPTESPSIPGAWSFCGLPISSPLGIAAGPLLNGKWVAYYASLGFDVFTYKTVRSRPRECYDLPNLVPVFTEQLEGKHDSLPATTEKTGTWAVSFGMPSMDPSFWEQDIRWTKGIMKKGQLLSVSVVGTAVPGETRTALAEDYANCAQWASEAGADAIELNFSCPNVDTPDGQLFQQPDAAELVARTVDQRLSRDLPLLIKIGFQPDQENLQSLVEEVAPYVDAIVSTNSIPGRVHAPDGSPLFEGNSRGICGTATREASLRQVSAICDLISRRDLHLKVVGVGGIETARDVRRYLDAGAESVQLASAVMHDPEVGLKIRSDWK
ncbi:MAG: tRNA-dihydrouridine synthase [Planctomycetaceae bacterium]|nr:tRNA-dihydrouridine synthase [Planctomycetaceae bacterium]